MMNFVFGILTHLVALMAVAFLVLCLLRVWVGLSRPEARILSTHVRWSHALTLILWTVLTGPLFAGLFIGLFHENWYQGPLLAIVAAPLYALVAWYLGAIPAFLAAIFTIAVGVFAKKVHGFTAALIFALSSYVFLQTVTNDDIQISVLRIGISIGAGLFGFLMWWARHTLGTESVFDDNARRFRP